MSLYPQESLQKNIEGERIEAEVTWCGLCSTCILASTCTFPRDPGRPVLHCDEFCGDDAPPTSTCPDVITPGPGTETNAITEESGECKYTGLCSCCDRRDTCTYPKPLGGVWHCDEYA
jgi:hypothetical protein